MAKAATVRVRIRGWGNSLQKYKELVGIECERVEDVEILRQAFQTNDLLECPRNSVAKTIVVPKEALRFLPLKDLKGYKKVELRHVNFVADPIRTEVQRRFLSNNKGTVHYYKAVNGFEQPVYCRTMVPLSTIREIEKSLS